MVITENPKGLFFTGTDTGVGKTSVAAALVKNLVEQGLSVGVFKPAETAIADVSTLGPDGKLLKWAADSLLHDNQIGPYRLHAPLPPAAAATHEKIRIDFNGLIQIGREIIESHDFTVIDGSGGLMTPLAGGLLMADLAAALDLPLVVVCKPGPGTINHILMTLFTAKTMELKVAGYLINDMPSVQTLSEETIAHSLAVMTGDELLGVLESVTGTDQEKVTLLAQQLAKMKTLSLLKPYLPAIFT